MKVDIGSNKYDCSIRVSQFFANMPGERQTWPLIPLLDAIVCMTDAYLLSWYRECIVSVVWFRRARIMIKQVLYILNVVHVLVVIYDW